MILVALHGFLGSPKDWTSLLVKDIVAPDLAVWATRAEVTDLESFAFSMNEKVRDLRRQREENGKMEAVAMAGYSMGARLAAYCLLEDPELYSSALLISMNPGLAAPDVEARRKRLSDDIAWSDRLRAETWQKVCEAWNNQAVLKPGARVKFHEQQAQALTGLRLQEGRRQAWARALEIWSLAHQKDLRQGLTAWAQDSLFERQLTLMTGTDDAKFTELTKTWMESMNPGPSSHRPVRHRLVLGAGHRILTEAPEDVISELSSLLSTEQT